VFVGFAFSSRFFRKPVRMTDRLARAMSGDKFMSFAGHFDVIDHLCHDQD
jgi:hypothetical protein